MPDKNIFALAALITIIVVTLYAWTDYEVVQSEPVTPENIPEIPEIIHRFAEPVTTPLAPGPLDLPYAMMVEIFSFVKGKLPSPFKIFIQQVADKVSATYVEFVGVLADWYADFRVLTNSVSAAYRYLVGPYHSWALECLADVASKLASIPMQLFSCWYDYSIKLMNWCMSHYNAAISEFVSDMIRYHEWVSMGQLAVVVPTLVRLLLKTHPVFITTGQDSRPFHLYGPRTEKELRRIRDGKTKAWLSFQRKNVKNSFNWLKVNHLPLVEKGLAPAAWERRTSYLLTRDRFPEWMLGNDNIKVWRYILTRDPATLWSFLWDVLWDPFWDTRESHLRYLRDPRAIIGASALYDTRLTVATEEIAQLARSLRTDEPLVRGLRPYVPAPRFGHLEAGDLQLTRSLRTGPARFEDSQLGSYKEIYILNSHTNTKVIKYISGALGIVFGNPPGEAGITGSVQFNVGPNLGPTPVRVPPSFEPIPTSRFTGWENCRKESIPGPTHICDVEDRPDTTHKPIWWTNWRKNW